MTTKQTTTVLFFALASALTVPGCAPDESLDLVGGTCEETETTLGLEDETDFGVAASDLIDLLPESAESTIVYLEGELTDSLNWGITVDEASLRLIERAPSDSDLDLACRDSLAVDGELSLASEGGQLDAALAVTFEIVENGAAGAVFSVEIDEADLGADFPIIDADGGTLKSFVVSGVISAGDLIQADITAVLEQEGELDEGSSGDSSTTSATLVLLAAIGDEIDDDDE